MWIFHPYASQFKESGLFVWDHVPYLCQLNGATNGHKSHVDPQSKVLKEELIQLKVKGIIIK